MHPMDCRFSAVRVPDFTQCGPAPHATLCPGAEESDFQGHAATAGEVAPGLPLLWQYFVFRAPLAGVVDVGAGPPSFHAVRNPAGSGHACCECVGRLLYGPSRAGCRTHTGSVEPRHPRPEIGRGMAWQGTRTPDLGRSSKRTSEDQKATSAAILRQRDHGGSLRPHRARIRRDGVADGARRVS